MNLSELSPKEIADLAEALSVHPDYRVLRRLIPRHSFAPSAPGQVLQTGVVLDTETTGLSSQDDQVIELGMIAFEFDPVLGTVHSVREVFDDECGGDTAQIEALAAGKDCRQNFFRVGCSEHELHVRRWFFERLEQRVERRR
jgi:hypothetical protein